MSVSQSNALNFQMRKTQGNALISMLQAKSATQSQGEALISMLQSKKTALAQPLPPSPQPLPSSQMLLNALRSDGPQNAAFIPQSSSICEISAPKKSEEALNALKKLLVIPQQTLLSPSPLKNKTETVVYSKTSVKKNKTATVTANVTATATAKVSLNSSGKENTNTAQKEKKMPVKEPTLKSRSNSEDEFYAGSAILNSPHPTAIPMPDFEEVTSDFFTLEVSSYPIKKNLSVDY